MSEEKVIGVLGGMGPAATAELLRRIVAYSGARRDQDCPRVIINCNTKVPDRTEAILGQGPSPLPALVETAKNLERAGADFIVMPCNTAHYYIDEIRLQVRVPVVDMIEEVARYVAANYPHNKRVGLLATTGTLRARLYESRFSRFGIQVIVPSEERQRDVMLAIRLSKANRLKEAKLALEPAIRELLAKGVELIVVGCTDLSLLDLNPPGVPVVDSLDVLAKVAVDIARGAREVNTHIPQRTL